MVALLYKWLLIGLMAVPDVHPYYVSVTEIGYNANAQTLEVHCKIFSDDLEETLKMHVSEKVDVLHPAQRKQTAKQISDYIPKHLKVKVDGEPVAFQFIGYEVNGEGISSYFEGKVDGQPETMEVMNNLLYEYKREQMGILHVTVMGKRQSTRLINPEANAVFSFK